MSERTSLEPTIRRLIARHQLDRVEIATGDGKLYVAAAYPAPWGAIVMARREAAFAAAGKAEFSLKEAAAVSEKAAAEPLARVTGNTITEALAALEKALQP